MSVIDDGVGNSRIASMYLGSGSIVDSVTLNPAKSEALLTNANFSSPNTTPDFPTKISNLIVLHQCYSRSVS